VKKQAGNDDRRFEAFGIKVEKVIHRKEKLSTSN
jgi:hypothetical protein